MKRQDFNQGWNYHKEGSGEGVPVTLPHDAMIHDTRDPESPGGHANAYFLGGVYVYEKRFQVPAEWERKHVLFEFGGVYKNTTVYLNDKEAGGRPYGYVPFTVCGDGFLKYGEENNIKVVADNSRLPNSRWYSGGGIYRPVSLIVGEQTHIKWEGVRISTLSYRPARIRVETQIETETKIQAETQIQAETKIQAETQTQAETQVQAETQTQAETQIRAEAQVQGGTRTQAEANMDGAEVYVEILDSLDGNQVIASGTGENIVLDIPDAKLWSEETPDLYRYRVILKEKNKVVDEAEGSFGIRKVEWNKNGLFVNGKETLLRGACIHHDNGVLGACTYAKAEERRIRILKENGYNAVRMSHHPAGRELLDACDRYGMYVMDETFDMWYYRKNKYDYAADFPAWYLKDIEAMVEQDFNHPSVIMYSIGNEVSEPYKPEGVAKAKEMIDFIHRLDGNRAVTAGMNLMIMYMASKGKGIYKEEGGRAGEEKKAGKQKKKKAQEEASGSLFFNLMVSMIGTGMNKQANSDKADQVVSPVLDELDIAGYNYASGRYPLEGEKHPGRIIVGSETFPQDIAKNWAMVKKYPYLIGDFMWTGWDYIGEAAIGAWNYEGVTMQNVPYPWMLADVGAIDIIGTVGAQAKYASVVWGLEKKPYIGVRPVNHPGKRVSKAVWRGTNAFASWAWKDCDGNKAEVEVYVDAAYVKLYVNGVGVGKKRIKDYKAMFKTRYQQGILTAVAYDKHDREIGRSELRSANGKEKLSVKPEDTKAAPGEIVYVDIAVVGENGVIESNSDRTLTVTVENGELLGFGSAKPNPTEQFGSGTYTTYYGRALAVVRAGEAGTMKVIVTGDGVGGEYAEIEVE